MGVNLLGINSGLYVNNTVKYLELNDLYNGLIKAAVFGVILSTIGCYKGFYASGGAHGVGKATTEAVVLASVLILINDYFLTSIMF